MDEPGYTLHRAARWGSADEIRALLLSGVDLNAQDDLGRTPLHLAAAERREDAVVLLLEAGASTDVLDNDRASPLDCAAGSGSLATVRPFFRPTQIRQQAPSVNKCWKAAAWAAFRGHLEVFSFLLVELQGRDALGDQLLYSCPQKGREAIRQVARLGRVEMASELLGRWSRAVRLKLDKEDSTMLIVAAGYGQALLVRLLLDKGADALHQNKQFLNALSAGASSASVEVINVLWEHTERTVASRMKLLQLWNASSTKHPPLCKAAQKGRLQNVQRLVKLGLDLNTTDREGHTPLNLASRGGDRCKDVELWLKLNHTERLNDGAKFRDLIRELDVRAVDWRDVGLLTRVVEGRSAAVASALLDRWPAAVQIENTKGRAMLHEAARCNGADLVRTLLKYGAELLQQDRRGRTALHYAAECGAEEVIRALWEHTENKGSREDLQRVVKGRAEENPPLSLAAGRGHLDAVKLLLEYGADLLQRDSEGWTALQYAAERGSVEMITALWGHKGSGAELQRLWEGRGEEQPPLCLAAKGSHLDAVKLLLMYGADLLHRDTWGRTALQYAAERGSVKMITALWGHTEDRESRPELHRLWEGREEQPPLCLAAAGGHQAAVKLLLEYGADLQQRDRRRRAALHCAAECGSVEVIRALWEHTENKGSRAWLKGLVEGRGEREPPLCLAAWRGHLAAAQLLLEYGADLLQRDSRGLTPLHRAAGGGHLAAAQLLVKLGADVNMGQLNGAHLTPLYWATDGAHAEVVRWLLEAGARVVLSEGKDSPLHAAVRWESVRMRGRLAVVQLLLPEPAQLREQERRERLALLQHGGEGGDTALHRAVDFSAVEVVQLLLTREVQLLQEHCSSRVLAGQSPQWEGFTVYRRDAQGRTALQRWNTQGQSSFAMFPPYEMWLRAPEVLRVLLRHMEDERVMALGGLFVEAVRAMLQEAVEDLERKLRGLFPGWTRPCLRRPEECLQLLRDSRQRLQQRLTQWTVKTMSDVFRDFLKI